MLLRKASINPKFHDIFSHPHMIFEAWCIRNGIYHQVRNRTQHRLRRSTWKQYLVCLLRSYMTWEKINERFGIITLVVRVSTHDFMAFSFIDIRNSKHGAYQVVFVIGVNVCISVPIWVWVKIPESKSKP